MRLTRNMMMAAMLATGAAASATSDTLTLMSYNIHVGIPMGKKFGEYTVTESDLSNIADVITTAAAADVVGMQEVDCEYGLLLPPEKRRTSTMNEPRILAHMTGMHYVFGSAQDDIKYPSDNAGYVEWGTPDHWKNNGMPHGEVGNCLLSRLPMREPPRNISLPRHPEKERRAALRAELLQPDGSMFQPPIIVYGTHFQHDRTESRVDQMKALVTEAASDSNFLVFIIGDLNSVAGSSTETVVLNIAKDRGFVDLHEQYARAHSRVPENTFPADAPDSRIDYVLCNRPVEVLEARVIPTLASDHLPLMVRVRLPGAR